MATAHEGSKFRFKVYKECGPNTDGTTKVDIERGIHWKEHTTLYKFDNAFISEELSRIISTICPEDSSLSFHIGGYTIPLQIKGKRTHIYSGKVTPNILSKEILQQVYVIVLENRPEFKKTGGIDKEVINYKNLVTILADMPKSTLEVNVGDGFIYKRYTDESRGGAVSQWERLETPEARNAVFLKIDATGEINDIVELEGKVGDALASLNYTSGLFWPDEKPTLIKR